MAGFCRFLLLVLVALLLTASLALPAAARIGDPGRKSYRGERPADMQEAQVPRDNSTSSFDGR